MNVEVDVSFGLPAFTMVGLPDPSVRESRDRIRSAIRNSGFEFPLRRITVNLAPADVRKAGSSFDLPIAIGILAATGDVRRRDVDDVLVLGELSLDGGIQAARGVLPIAAAARRRRFRGLLAAGSQHERSGGGRAASTSTRCNRSPKRSRRSTTRSRSLVLPRCPSTSGLPDWRTSPTCAARPLAGGRSRSPLPVVTTCCWPARRDRARR